MPDWRAGYRRRFYRFLIFRGEGAQGMLNAVAELAQHPIGNIRRVLGDEPDADPFGADQPHDLFYFLQQHRRRVGEQQVRLIKEEHQLWLIEIARFRQVLVKPDSSHSRLVA